MRIVTATLALLASPGAGHDAAQDCRARRCG